VAAGGRGWGLGGAGGTAAGGAFGGRFRDRGAGLLCFVLARASHAVGRGLYCAGRERAVAWAATCAGPGRAVAGGVRWGVRGRGGGAAASGPILQGFGRACRQRVS
jgi:hypothetical protein